MGFGQSPKKIKLIQSYLEPFWDHFNTSQNPSSNIQGDVLITKPIRKIISVALIEFQVHSASKLTHKGKWKTGKRLKGKLRFVFFVKISCFFPVGFYVNLKLFSLFFFNFLTCFHQSLAVTFITEYILKRKRDLTFLFWKVFWNVMLLMSTWMSVSLFKYYGAGGNCLEAKKSTLQHNKFLTCKPLGKSLFIITSWFTELRMPVSSAPEP